jgi:hypothetical protein
MPEGQPATGSLGEDVDFLSRTRQGLGGVEIMTGLIFGLEVPPTQFDRIQNRCGHGHPPQNKEVDPLSIWALGVKVKQNGISFYRWRTSKNGRLR